MGSIRDDRAGQAALRSLQGRGAEAEPEGTPDALQLRVASHISRLLRAIPALRHEREVHEQGQPGALPG